MKIVSAEVHHLQIPMETGGPHGWGSEEWKALDFALLELVSDAGLTGWGEGWAYGPGAKTVAAIRSCVVPRLIGEEVTDVASFTDALLTESVEEDYGVTPAFAISAANVALWDLAGKAAGVPLHRLFGDAKADRFPVFAGLFQFDDAEIVKTMCRRALADGMCWLKLHEYREECIAAAREVAPEVPLIVDAYRAWTAEDAAEVAEMLRPFNLHWLEEPIEPPSDLEGLSPFASAGIPTALGESARTTDDFQKMIDAGTVTFLQPGITKMGGIEKVREVIGLERNPISLDHILLRRSSWRIPVG